MKVLKTKSEPDASHAKSDVMQAKNVRPSKNAGQQPKLRDSLKIVNEKTAASDQVSFF